MIDSPAGRRPLKTRDWRFFQRLAAWLATTPITPNIISATSIFFGLAAGTLLAFTPHVGDDIIVKVIWLTAAACLQARLIANLLDGMVAIEGGKASAIGELFNEVPDRVSDSAIFIGAGYAIGSVPEFGLLAALVAIFVAYVRAIGASVGVGQVFLGPMAKQQRMAVLTLALVLCGLLPASWQPVHSPSGIGIIGVVLIAVAAGGVVTAIRRLMRIANLMRARATDGAATDV
ncbi:CDP-alcohol phosphatidyltransferase family protein [Stratiformator vulcanicus]|uniref:CDP-alcohol phosphatidyltransferase n=1 Tax=Stratiformator vulcanicus TaxID=2527980 RepID=A0A517R6N2_9PLAN|nr:CDP-alcohol phosphatidyltransferase family protein [Stratiformator vulcanicus]QDT39502.1 CDP-alcohol phosphatidyltransferase [Stratiformator vulcanicus]